MAFKFPVPKDAPTAPSDRDMLNLLHKSEPPCLANSMAIFAGPSWGEFRGTLGQTRPRGISNNKRKKLEPQDSFTDQPDQIDYAEIFPNDKIILTFLSGNIVPLSYGTFTAQDAVTLLGPPSEVYTKSDNRLNIHNGTRHDEIDTGPLSQGTSLHPDLLTASPRVFL